MMSGSGRTTPSPPEALSTQPAGVGAGHRQSMIHWEASASDTSKLNLLDPVLVVGRQVFQ